MYFIQVNTLPYTDSTYTYNDFKNKVQNNRFIKNQCINCPGGAIYYGTHFKFYEEWDEIIFYDGERLDLFINNIFYGNIAGTGSVIKIDGMVAY